MLVGSSRSSKSGLEKSARANANLILQPPENVFVARSLTVKRFGSMFLNNQKRSLIIKRFCSMFLVKLFD